MRIAVHVVLGEVGEGLADDCCLLGEHGEILACGGKRRVIGVGVLVVEYLLQFGILYVVHHVADERYGDEVVLVLLDNLEATERSALRYVVQLRTKLVGEFLQLGFAHAALLCLRKLGVERLFLVADGVYLAVVGVELRVLLRTGEQLLSKVGYEGCAVVDEGAVVLLGDGESEQSVLLSVALQRKLAVFHGGAVYGHRATAVNVYYIYFTDTFGTRALDAVLSTGG